MPQHSVFLDNRQMQGKPGFFVLTPLRIEGTSAVVVVQRGWVARNFLDRNQLPRIPTASGLVEVSGRLEGPPPRLLDLGGKKGPPDDSRAGTSSGSKGSPDIRQNLALDSFADETKLPVLPLTVVQTKPAAHFGADAPPDGLLRDWPQVSSGASKNYGYAAQWFALSVLIAGLYLWFQFGKAYVAKKRS